MFWSRGFCLITTEGAPIDVVEYYIKNQRKKYGLVNVKTIQILWTTSVYSLLQEILTGIIKSYREPLDKPIKVMTVIALIEYILFL